MGIGLKVGDNSNRSSFSTNDCRTHELADPLPTVTSVDAWGIAQPFLVSLKGTDNAQIVHSARSIDEPVPALTAGGNHVGMVEPFIVSYHGASYEGGDRARSINEPLPAVATNNQFGLAEPFLVEFHSNGHARSLDEPLPTITTKDRVGLAEPVILTDGNGRQYKLGVRFRMLQPHELAAAMSFPKDYEFTGSRENKVRQIGNAVPVNTAAALIGAMLQ